MDIDEYDADYRSGSIIYRWTEKKKEADKRRNKKIDLDDTESHILDYFIIGNDRLHIIVGDKFSLHFKIVELSDKTTNQEGHYDLYEDHNWGSKLESEH